MTAYTDYVYNLDKLTIYVTEDPEEDVDVLNGRSKCAAVTRLNNALFNPRLHFDCPEPLKGRYVYVKATGVANRWRRLFTVVLCEVMVYWTKVFSPAKAPPIRLNAWFNDVNAKETFMINLSRISSILLRSQDLYEYNVMYAMIVKYLDPRFSFCFWGSRQRRDVFLTVFKHCVQHSPNVYHDRFSQQEDVCFPLIQSGEKWWAPILLAPIVMHIESERTCFTRIIEQW